MFPCRQGLGLPATERFAIGCTSMSDTSDSSSVFLRLTRAEALVFFEWLARQYAAGGLPVEDPAEEQVLSRLEGQLESKLTEPLGQKYKEAVGAARREVRGPKP
jgi:hypothetical protein